MPDAPTLPAWPRVLSDEMAAKYVDLSVSTFARLVARGVAPPPIRLTPGRVGWDRHALDRWIDQQAAGTAASAGSNPCDSILGGHGPAEARP